LSSDHALTSDDSHSHGSSSSFKSDSDSSSSLSDSSNSSSSSPFVLSSNHSSSRLISHPGDSPSHVDSSALDSFHLSLGLTTSAGSDNSADLTFLAFFAELAESVSSVHGNASSSVEFATLGSALDLHGLCLCSSSSSSFSGSCSSSSQKLTSSDLKLFLKSSGILSLQSSRGSLCLRHNGALGCHHLCATAATAGVRVGV